jgi:hypothetical protein
MRSMALAGSSSAVNAKMGTTSEMKTGTSAPGADRRAVPNLLMRRSILSPLQPPSPQ